MTQNEWQGEIDRLQQGLFGPEYYSGWGVLSVSNLQRPKTGTNVADIVQSMVVMGPAVCAGKKKRTSNHRAWMRPGKKRAMDQEE